MAFVAMGFDHVVANMFFLPAAIFSGAGDITWGDTLHNWLFAGLGNFVGAALFVAGAYWYLYARPEEPEAAEPGGINGDGHRVVEPAGVGASGQPAG
jgi:formate/nitrite transporter FocA (FNT family)